MKVVRTTGRSAKRARALITQLERRHTVVDERAAPVARRIIESIRRGGDVNLRRFSARFDGLAQQTPSQVSPDEMNQAWREASSGFRSSIQQAARNIQRFAQKQMPKSWTFEQIPGLEVGQQVRPLKAVGCYVPGGRHPLPSTMLMTVIPAQVAGVQRIVVVSPKPAPETLAVAGVLGITEFYRIGGAQAIAAL